MSKSQRLYRSSFCLFTPLMALFLSGFLSGCSLFEISLFGSDSEDAAVEQAEESNVEKAKPSAAETNAGERTASIAEQAPPVEAVEDTEEVSSVEILWQVPGEAVEKYYLRYGTDDAVLDTSVVIMVRELDKIDHPDYGPLFRYVVSGVPAKQTIYFTIQAENQYGLSPASPVQQVAPK
jgi:hypothetical protein